MAYDVVSNSTLWFLPPPPLRPGPAATLRPPLWSEAWDAYRAFNALFAAVVGRGRRRRGHGPRPGLPPVPGARAAAPRSGPTCSTVHFTHTPFADPDMFAGPAQPVGRELLEGMAAAQRLRLPHGALGGGLPRLLRRHGRRRRATPSCRRSPPTPTHLGGPGRLGGSAGRPGARLDELLGRRRMVVRVDRIEPAKNLLRGFWAFDELLRDAPELAGRGRDAGPRLRRRARRCRSTSPTRPRSSRRRAGSTTRGAPTTGRPIVLDVADDPGRSFAALMRYDVLLVNPLRDGLNLVAKEGPLRQHDRRRAGAVARGGRLRRAATPPRSRSTPSTWPARPRCSSRRSTWHRPSGPGGPEPCAALVDAAQARGLARRPAGRRAGRLSPSPLSWLPAAWAAAASACSRASASAGPGHHHVGGATSSGGDSSSATATRTVAVPVAARRSRAAKAARSPASSPAKHAAAHAVRQLARPPSPCRWRPAAGTPGPSATGLADEAGALAPRRRAKAEHARGRPRGPGASAPSPRPPCPRSPRPSPAKAARAAAATRGHGWRHTARPRGRDAPCRPRSTRARRRR